jgi:hypothetical protein
MIREKSSSTRVQMWSSCICLCQTVVHIRLVSNQTFIIKAIIIIIIIIIINSGSAAQRGLWPPRSRGFVITLNDAPQSVELLWMSDQLVAETST